MLIKCAWWDLNPWPLGVEGRCTTISTKRWCAMQATLKFITGLKYFVRMKVDYNRCNMFKMSSSILIFLLEFKKEIRIYPNLFSWLRGLNQKMLLDWTIISQFSWLTTPFLAHDSFWQTWLEWAMGCGLWVNKLALFNSQYWDIKTFMLLFPNRFQL